MNVLLPVCLTVVLLYLAYLVSLGFSGAFESLMDEREADGDHISRLDRIVMAGAALWISLMLVPEFLGSHVTAARMLIRGVAHNERP
jgi:hypothetical protein